MAVELVIPKVTSLRETKPIISLIPAARNTSNPFLELVDDQKITYIPSFTLECGVTLHNVPVAYKTWGRLSPIRDNVMVVCHALTGSANAAEWWSSLFGGAGYAIDTTRFFVICMNCLGSPYGTASPITGRSPGQRWGPDFPPTTIRDDVRLHKALLDSIGITQIAVAIGASMGGMLVLEWAFFGSQYVRAIIPIATAAQSGGWSIAWGEAQRQSILSDHDYRDGYYELDEQPRAGLGAARMIALLTYRSRNSFEARFGRQTTMTRSSGPRPQRWEKPTPSSATAGIGIRHEGSKSCQQTNGHFPFTAQTYLRYQADKFVRRFDANCYLAIVSKIDTHSISRGRADTTAAALAAVEQPALIIGLSSDVLYPVVEQEELADGLPNARLVVIDSEEGHDGCLMKAEAKIVNDAVVGFLKEICG